VSEPQNGVSTANPAAPDVPASPPLFALSSAVFAQRDRKILILKRAAGEAPGTWYLPGGAVDPDETVEESARRELFEEAGLVAVGGFTCVAVAHMRTYGFDSLQVLYACDCPDGDVVLSHEHSGARWIDAREYRERYFADDTLERIAEADPRMGQMLRNIRDAIDAYLRWRALQPAH
jgi:8-oxo-dGTP pyrophosphatase MutT (NUDIX family)